MLFVNNSFGQTTSTDDDRNKSSNNKPDNGVRNQSSNHTSDNVDKNKTENTAFMNTTIIGAGILFILAAVTVKKKK